jgi:hypothetical protein
VANVVHQNDPATEFTLLLVLDLGMKLLQNDCTVRLFQVQKLRFLEVKENSEHHFTGGCMRLEFLEQGWKQGSLLHACWFSVGSLWVQNSDTMSHHLPKSNI